MRNNILVLLIMDFILIAVIGCSSHSVNPVSIPSAPATTPQIEIPSTEIESGTLGHELLGAWTMTFDPDEMNIIVESNRMVGWHFNVKSYIPSPGITLNSWDPVTKIIDIDVTLRNPYPITGYDVRLIIYTDDVGHMLMNADDWTALYDISGGKNINPFKAYAKSEPNRKFAGSTSHVENLLIYMDSSFNVNFAVDASYPSNCQEPYEIWDFTQEEPLYDRREATAAVHVKVRCWNPTSTVRAFIECFGVFEGIELNTSDNELFYGIVDNDEDAPVGEYQVLLSADILENAAIDLYDTGTLVITEKPIYGWVWHWPNEDSCGGVETDGDGNIYFGLYPSNKIVSYTKEPTERWQYDLDLSGPFGQIQDLSCHQDFDYIYSTGNYYYCGTSLFSGMGIAQSNNGNGTTEHNYKCFRNLVGSYEIESDSNGNAYIAGDDDRAGSLVETVMWKVNSSLTEQWNNIWENKQGGMKFTDLEISNNDTIFGAGEFWGTVVDFDPSDEVANNYPQGYRDAFIFELDSSGERIDSAKWGGYEDDTAMTYVNVIGSDDDGEVFVAGTFNGTVDFHSHMLYEDIKTSTEPGADIYISKFNSSFLFMKNVQISGNDLVNIPGMAIDPAGNIYICGSFEGTVDFDPGSGVVQRTAKGAEDMFLAKYTNSLGFIYVQTWGAAGASIYANDIAYDRTFNYVYVVGGFQGTIDFDPGEGVATKTATSYSPFLMRLLPNGTWEY